MLGVNFKSSNLNRSVVSLSLLAAVCLTPLKSNKVAAAEGEALTSSPVKTRRTAAEAFIAPPAKIAAADSDTLISWPAKITAVAAPATAQATAVAADSLESTQPTGRRQKAIQLQTPKPSQTKKVLKRLHLMGAQRALLSILRGEKKSNSQLMLQMVLVSQTLVGALHLSAPELHLPTSMAIATCWSLAFALLLKTMFSKKVPAALKSLGLETTLLRSIVADYNKLTRLTERDRLTSFDSNSKPLEPKFVEALKKYTDKKYAQGYRLVHIAGALGDAEMLAYMMRRSSVFELQVQDDHGHTAFELAVLGGNSSVARLFAMWHADKVLNQNAGLAPIDSTSVVSAPIQSAPAYWSGLEKVLQNLKDSATALAAFQEQQHSALGQVDIKTYHSKIKVLNMHVHESIRFAQDYVNGFKISLTYDALIAEEKKSVDAYLKLVRAILDDAENRTLGNIEDCRKLLRATH